MTTTSGSDSGTFSIESYKDLLSRLKKSRADLKEARDSRNQATTEEERQERQKKVRELKGQSHDYNRQLMRMRRKNRGDIREYRAQNRPNRTA